MNNLPVVEAIPVIPSENIQVIYPVEYSQENTFNSFVNIINELELSEFIKNNYLIIGANQNGNNTVEQMDLSRKIVLCLGGESEGFDNLIIKKINKLITIKKIGHGESLNVAIAGSILMNYLSQK